MIKILLVDDDQINSKIFTKRLKKRGHDTENVYSGLACVEFVKSYFEEEKHKINPLIILLDIIMPELDGTDVLKMLREKYSPMELPIIMMSAKDEAEEVVECFSLGANDFISKPANIDIACARILTQTELISLYQGNMKKKQLETINSMVATFNHEINNPLTIALGSLRRDFSKLDEKRINIAIDALMRISSIVKKIEKVTKTNEVEEEIYVDQTMMIKLK